jgi:hypothetical protein
MKISKILKKAETSNALTTKSRDLAIRKGKKQGRLFKK